MKLSDLVPMATVLNVDQYIYISKSIFLNIWTNTTNKIVYLLNKATDGSLVAYNANDFNNRF